MDTKQLEILLKFVLEKAGLNNAKQGVGDVTARVKALQRQVNETRQAMEKLGQVSSQMAMAGGAIVTPIVLAARSYVQAVGTLDATSAKAQASMNRMSQVQLRIGKAATEIMNPALEQTADILEKLADIIERNPWILKTALGGGSLLLGAGAVGGAVSGVGKTLLTVGGFLGPLLAKAGLGGAAAAGAEGAAATGGLGLAAVAVPTAAIFGGAALGAGTYQGLTQTPMGKKMGLATLEQFATVGANTLGNVFGKVSTALGLMDDAEARRKTDVFTAVIGKLTGAIDENSPIWQKAQAALPKSSQKEPIITQPMLQAFAAYEEAQQRRIDYEKESEAERTQIVEKAGKERAKIESNLAESALKLRVKAALAEAQAYEDYLLARRQRVEQANKEEQRAEEDFQRSQREALQTHKDTLYELALKGDAVGIDLENKRFKEQTDAAEEEHNLQMSRMNEDLADELRAMNQAYRLQRARREEQLQQQIKDEQEAAKKQLEAIEAQKQEELKLLDDASKKQLDLLKKAEEQRLAELRYIALNDVAALERSGAEMMAKFRGWLEANSNNLTFPNVYGGAGNTPYGPPKPGISSGGGGNSGAIAAYKDAAFGAQDLGLAQAAGSAISGQMINSGATSRQSGGPVVNIYTDAGSISSGQLDLKLRTLRDLILGGVDEALDMAL